MAQATLNGYLDDDGGEACVCGFEYGLTPSMSNTVTASGTYRTGDSFSVTLTLASLDYYYFRSFATNSTGTSYGSTLTFGSLASVTTLAATSTGTLYPQLNGRLDDDQSVACECRFNYGLTPAMGSKTPNISGLSTGDSFSANINVLPGTLYYFEAEAVNYKGTAKGGILTFTSPGTPLGPSGPKYIVTTLPPTNIGSRATLNGKAEETFGKRATVKFEYGTGSSYGSKTSPQSVYNDEEFSSRISIAEGRAYHYRAVMIIDGVTVYGNDMAINSPSSLGPITFITGDLLPMDEG